MSIEAMKQALEALEYANELIDTVIVPNAIASLRQVIAETEKQELLFEVDGEMLTANQIAALELFKFQEATGCDTADEFKAEKQEPIGITDDDGNAWMYGYLGPKFPPNTPLYTSPQPKRKRLTYEQVINLADRFDWDKDCAVLFARAIEAAHGIKGEA